MKMKMDLTDKQIAEYLHRSYTAVDGLWFMKSEEKYGFEAALLMDEAVWKVLPKIQARMLKAMIGLDNGIHGLRQAVLTRLTLEGFEFEVEDISDIAGIKIYIKRCPWQDLLVKSGRESLCGRVGDLICGSENSVFASEFGDIAFKRDNRICGGDEKCTLLFVQSSKEP
jgi:hypothetical protein